MRIVAKYECKFCTPPRPYVYVQSLLNHVRDVHMPDPKNTTTGMNHPRGI